MTDLLTIAETNGVLKVDVYFVFNHLDVEDTLQRAYELEKTMDVAKQAFRNTIYEFMGKNLDESKKILGKIEARDKVKELFPDTTAEEILKIEARLKSMSIEDHRQMRKDLWAVTKNIIKGA